MSPDWVTAFIGFPRLIARSRNVLRDRANSSARTGRLATIPKGLRLTLQAGQSISFSAWRSARPNTAPQDQCHRDRQGGVVWGGWQILTQARNELRSLEFVCTYTQSSCLDAFAARSSQHSPPWLDSSHPGLRPIRSNGCLMPRTRNSPRGRFHAPPGRVSAESRHGHPSHQRAYSGEPYPPLSYRPC